VLDILFWYSQLIGIDQFHVHIVNANQSGLLGVTVGQAHLLDDVISMVCTQLSAARVKLNKEQKLEVDSDHGPSIFERMTLTYGLGHQHPLFEALKTAEA
jgi:m7GpppX diphosphatase